VDLIDEVVHTLFTFAREDEDEDEDKQVPLPREALKGCGRLRRAASVHHFSHIALLGCLEI
jgi:hypothetical protein